MPNAVTDTSSLPLDIKQNVTLGPGVEVAAGAVAACKMPSACKSYPFEVKGNRSAVMDATLSAQIWDDYDLVLLHDGKEVAAARTHQSSVEHLHVTFPPGSYNLAIVGYIASSAYPVVYSPVKFEAHFTWA